ncbi:MAG: hypothetical protein GX138_03305 [Firmicutes bacterium]|nr:hypothetical protein [Bacillota bacterium]
MSNVKLFWLDEEQFEELLPDETLISSEQKVLIEKNLSVLFGMKFVVRDYPMDQDVIDTLALDSNGSPVILMFRKDPLHSPVNRGLNAMAWLQGHLSEIRLLVMHHLGEKETLKLNLNQARLICLSDHFNDTEISTASLTSVDIELLNCRFHDENLLAVNRLNLPRLLQRLNPYQPRIDELLSQATPRQKQLYQEFKNLLTGLGDDLRVLVKENEIIWARLRNLATVDFSGATLNIRLNLPSEAVFLEEMAEDFMVNQADKANEGGVLLLQLNSSEQLLQSAYLIIRAYRIN